MSRNSEATSTSRKVQAVQYIVNEYRQLEKDYNACKKQNDELSQKCKELEDKQKKQSLLDDNDFEKLEEVIVQQRIRVMNLQNENCSLKKENEILLCDSNEKCKIIENQANEIKQMQKQLKDYSQIMLKQDEQIQISNSQLNKFEKELVQNKIQNQMNVFSFSKPIKDVKKDVIAVIREYEEIFKDYQTKYKKLAKEFNEIKAQLNTCKIERDQAINDKFNLKNKLILLKSLYQQQKQQAQSSKELQKWQEQQSSGKLQNLSEQSQKVLEKKITFKNLFYPEQTIPIQQQEPSLSPIKFTQDIQSGSLNQSLFSNEKIKESQFLQQYSQESNQKLSFNNSKSDQYEKEKYQYRDYNFQPNFNTQQFKTQQPQKINKKRYYSPRNDRTKQYLKQRFQEQQFNNPQRQKQTRYYSPKNAHTLNYQNQYSPQSGSPVSNSDYEIKQKQLSKQYNQGYTQRTQKTQKTQKRQGKKKWRKNGQQKTRKGNKYKTMNDKRSKISNQFWSKMQKSRVPTNINRTSIQNILFNNPALQK